MRPQNLSKEVPNFCVTDIVIDSREKKPLAFKLAKVKTLKFGDYTLEGYENKISIERKSLVDFTSSIVGKDRKRFEQNIKLATKELDYYAIVLEASCGDLKNSSNWTKLVLLNGSFSFLLSSSFCY